MRGCLLQAFMNHRLQSIFVWGIVMLAGPVLAQSSTQGMPVSAEATTAVIPGKTADVEQRLGPRGRAPAKGDLIYTDGVLAKPELNAEDLGLASPSQRITIDAASSAENAQGTGSP